MAGSTTPGVGVPGERNAVLAGSGGGGVARADVALADRLERRGSLAAIPAGATDGDLPRRVKALYLSVTLVSLGVALATRVARVIRSYRAAATARI